MDPASPFSKRYVTGSRRTARQILSMLMNLDWKNLHSVPLPGQKEEKDLTWKDLTKVVCASTGLQVREAKK